MANTFIALPSRGDIVVGEISTGKVKFITLATFDLSSLDTTIYETIGVVVRRERYKVLICYKLIGSNLKYCDRSWWYLSGYNLETGGTGTITSNNGSAAISITITYNASTLADFIASLNTQFQADASFSAMDWYAEEYNGKVRLTCNAPAHQTFSNTTASNGFTITGSLPEIVISNRMMHINGSAGTLALGNMDKMVAYLTEDKNDTYNPSSELTTTRRDLGVRYNAYLGNSQYRQGYDYCHILREKYGEGETGWLKSLEATKPVLKCGNGILAQASGKEASEILSSTYTSTLQTTPKAFSPAAGHCHNIATTCLPAGSFYFPSIRELIYIMDGIHYGPTGTTRQSDDLNKGLYLLGGSEIKNNNNYMSCSRSSGGFAWHYYGIDGSLFGAYGGFFTYAGYNIIPVSTITIEH